MIYRQCVLHQAEMPMEIAMHREIAMQSLLCLLTMLICIVVRPQPSFAQSSQLAALTARVVAVGIAVAVAPVGIFHPGGPIGAFTQTGRLLEAERATAIAPQLLAAGDKIMFPERYADGVMYTTLDRPASLKPSATGLENAAQYHKFYATAAAIKALRGGEPIPSGAVITAVKYRAKLDPHGNPIKHENGRFVRGDLIGFSVMEKRTGWGAAYPSEIRNGEWEFQEFTADGKPNDKVNLLACFQCHRSQAHKDFLFTFDGIKAVFAK
jgi:cytochrome P460